MLLNNRRSTPSAAVVSVTPADIFEDFGSETGGVANRTKFWVPGSAADGLLGNWCIRQTGLGPI
jgi:hypothetical protein